MPIWSQILLGKIMHVFINALMYIMRSYTACSNAPMCTAALANFSIMQKLHPRIWTADVSQWAHMWPYDINQHAVFL